MSTPLVERAGILCVGLLSEAEVKVARIPNIGGNKELVRWVLYTTTYKAKMKGLWSMEVKRKNTDMNIK